MDYMVQHHHSLRNTPFEILDGATVLLVEPQPEDRSFYTSQLTGVNMKVVASDTLNSMRVMTQEHNPDVVIVNPSEDIGNGITLVKLLREEFPALPIITMCMTMREDHLDAIMQS